MLGLNSKQLSSESIETFSVKGLRCPESTFVRRQHNENARPTVSCDYCTSAGSRPEPVTGFTMSLAREGGKSKGRGPCCSYQNTTKNISNDPAAIELAIMLYAKHCIPHWPSVKISGEHYRPWKVIQRLPVCYNNSRET